MVEHIVLLKLKSDVTSAQLDALPDALFKMADEIPVLNPLLLALTTVLKARVRDIVTVLL